MAVSLERTQALRFAAPADTSVAGRERTFAAVVTTVGYADGAVIRYKTRGLRAHTIRMI